MSTSLKNLYISDSWGGLLHLNVMSLSGDFVQVYDGYGFKAPIQLGDDKLKIGTMKFPTHPTKNGDVLVTDGTDIMFRTIFPKNSVYFTVDNVNPEPYLGGKWVQIAKGRFIVGVGTGTDGDNTHNFSAGENWGEYSHRLSEYEMPNHKHNVLVGKVSVADDNAAGLNSGHSKRYLKNYGGSKSQSYTISHTGGGAKHNNNPPSFALYIWQRIE